MVTSRMWQLHSSVCRVMGSSSAGRKSLKGGHRHLLTQGTNTDHVAAAGNHTLPASLEKQASMRNKTELSKEECLACELGLGNMALGQGNSSCSSLTSQTVGCDPRKMSSSSSRMLIGLWYAWPLGNEFVKYHQSFPHPFLLKTEMHGKTWLPSAATLVGVWLAGLVGLDFLPELWDCSRCLRGNFKDVSVVLWTLSLYKLAFGPQHVL